MSVTGVLHAIRELVDIRPLLFQCPEVKLGHHLGERKGAQPHASSHSLGRIFLLLIFFDVWLGCGA